MGMFLSKYSMLNALGYGSDTYILPETQKILQRHKLKVLIIHDPKAHVSFNFKLTQLFEKLDFVTGPDLLFFCLVDPPSKWKNRTDRDYFGIWEPDKLLNPFNSYHSRDESITAYSLAQSMGIAYNTLPVLILTTDFRNNLFRYVKTSEEHLEYQLKELGFYCSQKEQIAKELDDSEFNKVISTIDLCSDSAFGKLKFSLAKVLTDFISFIVAKSKSNEAKQALNRCKEVISDFYTHKNTDQDNVEFESENITFLANLSNLLYDPYRDSRHRTEAYTVLEPQVSYATLEDTSPYDLNTLGMEHESLIIYNTFNKLRPVYRSVIFSYSDSFMGEIDYSPLVISLSKIFEIETNLSIVQWIRKYLNIEMPLYFNKRKVGSGNYSLTPSNELIPNAHPVDFNKGFGEKWNAPGIGESELIMKSLYKQGNYPKSEIKEFSAFLENWEFIRKYRNKAAHNNLINQADFNQVNSHFTSLKDKNCFYDMVQLKKSLMKAC